jgi:hypothetical protein
MVARTACASVPAVATTTSTTSWPPLHGWNSSPSRLCWMASARSIQAGARTPRTRSPRVPPQGDQTRQQRLWKSTGTWPPACDQIEPWPCGTLRAGGPRSGTDTAGGETVIIRPRQENAMAYNAEAQALRRCLGVTKSGRPCRNWACWNDLQQLCASHARHHTGPLPPPGTTVSKHAGYEPCRCVGYSWPHRPGSGRYCNWPVPATERYPTSAGTHRQPRWRMPRRLRPAQSS